MPATMKEVKRVFRYQGTELADPCPGSPVERALRMLSTQYPALTNAKTDAPSIEGGKEKIEVHTVKVAAGTKG